MTPGIFINDGQHPFTGWILSGAKTYETRSRRTLHRFIGKHVAIVRTGKGNPVVVGYADIDCCFECRDKAFYNTFRYETLTCATAYDWTPDIKVKYLYHLVNVSRCDPYQVPGDAVRHGRTWVELKED